MYVKELKKRINEKLLSLFEGFSAGIRGVLGTEEGRNFLFFQLKILDIGYMWHTPRLARLDMPGLLQHVIIRGIEKRKIEVGRELHLGPAGVSLAARRGAAFLRDNPEIKKKIISG